MAFDGRVFRVLIASPSDVHEEREIAVRVIQEWNDLHAYSQGVVILPLRWETHTAPEYGTRPQEAINRAIVDDCDLLIGVFWTRIGTPTGNADSGTLEEIERVAKAGKPVMLYFSKVGVDPERLDFQQMARLKEFKNMTYSIALVENYKSLIEFRDKLARQIELKVRDLRDSDSNSSPPLTLEFVDDNISLIGTEITRRTEIPISKNIDEAIEKLNRPVSSELRSAILSRIYGSKLLPVRLAINNSGTSGIRNLYVEISIKVVSGIAGLSDRIKQQFGEVFSDSLRSSERDYLDVHRNPIPIEKGVDGWHFSFEWGAIQPRRVKLIEPILFFWAEENSVVTISARVFADGFPEPVDLQGKLSIEVTRKDIPVDAYVPKNMHISEYFTDYQRLLKLRDRSEAFVANINNLIDIEQSADNEIRKAVKGRIEPGIEDP
jgi:hypothetical protein